MRWTACFILIVALLASTCAYCQQVTISGSNLRLEQVFTEIRKQTGFEFICASNILATSRPVTLDVSHAPLQQVLTTILPAPHFGFTIRGNTIVVFEQDFTPDAPLSADSFTLIRGHVVDSRGQPVQMASVVLKRTQAGVQTDRSGAFTLKLKTPKPTDTLYISFVGLKSRSIPLARKPSPDSVILEAADNVLDMSLVTAYGSTSERFRTGDITTIKASDIAKFPAPNVVEALEGRVPGLYVWQNNGNPSSVYTIQLRGSNVLPPFGGMFTGGAVNILSKPLVVIDGLPQAPEILDQSGDNLGVDGITGFAGGMGGQDPLYWLNPLDVESVSVLKDADATALYGSRAANGVILITTKKGKPGKTALNITANTGINAQVRRLDLLDTKQYLAMRHEAWANTTRAHIPVLGITGAAYTPNAANSPDLLVWDTTRYTDWQKFLLGSAPVYNANLELSGGEGRTGYRFSAGYNGWKSSYPGIRQNPVFREDKGTASLAVSTRSANNRLNLAATISFYVTSSFQPGYNPDNYIFLAPDAPPILDAAGNLNFPDWRPASIVPTIYTGNPLNVLATSYRNNRWGLNGRVRVTYELLHSLVLTVGAGYSRNIGKQLEKLPGAFYDPVVTRIYRLSQFGNTTTTGLNIEPALRYTTRWGRHSLSLLAGGSFQLDNQRGDIKLASGYISDDQMGSPTGADTHDDFSRQIQRRSVSALSQITYRYADRYLLDLSGRRDGSSSFGPGRRYGNFGSVGLGWIFTTEHWATNIPLISFGKIRGSYGITGTQNIDPWSWLSTWQVATLGQTGIAPSGINSNGNGIYQGVQSLFVTRVANPALGWAQATCIDLGADLYFLPRQQLKLTLQWYRKRTGDQLVPKPVSTVTGVTNYLANTSAEVQDAGIEGVLGYSFPATPSGLDWSIGINIAANKNKLLSWPGLANSPDSNYYVIGQPLIRQQLYPTFLNKRWGAYTTSDSTHLLATPYSVNSYPVFTGGLQANLSYKGFSLSISCTFAKQKGFTNMQGAPQPGVLSSGVSDLGGLGNQPRSVIRDKHWQSPANEAIGGAFLAATVSSPAMDRYWGDASYLALKNTSFNYRIPETWLHKMHLSALTFYVNAENLFLLSLGGYKGANPEQPGLATQIPLRKVLVGGFNITL